MEHIDAADHSFLNTLFVLNGAVDDGQHRVAGYMIQIGPPTGGHVVKDYNFVTLMK
jgi:hypothetical protein